MSAFTDDFVTIHHGDSWELASTLAPQSIHTIVTSPPYWGLRDYGEPWQFGLESTPEEYVARLVDLFARLRPALRDDGTVWLNLGDSYAANRTYQVHNTRGATEHTYSGGAVVPPGLKPKDLVGIPWRVAFALQADGWYLRSDIIWHKPNPMPESVTDRPTKAHEYLFLLSKSARYYYDHEAIKEPSVYDEWPGISESHADVNPKHQQNTRPMRTSKVRGEFAGKNTDPGKEAFRSIKPDGRNKRSVWTVATQPFSAAHFATFPPDLIKPCILAGCPEGGTVLDPFMGSGTTAQVARSLGRKAIGFELNAEYIEIAAKHRLAQGVLL